MKTPQNLYEYEVTPEYTGESNVVADTVAMAGLGLVIGGILGAYSADNLNSAFVKVTESGATENLFHNSVAQWAEIGAVSGLVVGLAAAGVLRVLDARKNNKLTLVES